MTNQCEISFFIDVLIDDFVVSKKRPKVNFVKFLQAQNIDRKTINTFVNTKTEFIESQIKELDLAMSGLDPQVKEGYGNFRKPELREFKEFLEQIITDLYSYKDSKRVLRKRKQLSPDKITKFINLYTDTFELSGHTYNSIPVTEVLGAKHIFLYNVETRELSYYTGRSLGIKRTMVTSFDVDKSWTRKLRKPEEFLSEVVNCTKYNIEHICNHLTTKAKVPTGRTNAKQILIKVIK